MDFSKATPDTLREVIREAESYLEGQVSFATSADQRVSVMASVFATAGTVIASALMTVAATEQIGDLVPVFVGGGIAAVLFVIAASCCVPLQSGQVFICVCLEVEPARACTHKQFR